MADESITPRKRIFHGGAAGRKCPSKVQYPPVQCEVCGAEFTPQRAWQKCCGKRCTWLKNDRVKAARRAKVPVASTPETPFGKRVCPVCNNSFIATRPDKKYCSHACYRKRMSQNWTNKNKSQGSCHSCDEPPIEGTNSFCRKHWLMQAAWRAGIRQESAWQAVEAVLVAQQFKCAYTGRLLRIGVNASIDHKLSRSTHPEKINSIENIEWVDSDVNLAKRAMTRAQFLAFCEEILRYSSKQQSQSQRHHQDAPGGFPGA